MLLTQCLGGGNKTSLPVSSELSTNPYLFYQIGKIVYRGQWANLPSSKRKTFIDLWNTVIFCTMAFYWRFLCFVQNRLISKLFRSTYHSGPHHTVWFLFSIQSPLHLGNIDGQKCWQGEVKIWKWKQLIPNIESKVKLMNKGQFHIAFKWCQKGKIKHWCQELIIIQWKKI